MGCGLVLRQPAAVSLIQVNIGFVSGEKTPPRYAGYVPVLSQGESETDGF